MAYPSRIEKGGFRWMDSGQGGFPGSGFPGFPERIQRAKVVIPQAFDNESLFAGSTGRWLPGGFPGENPYR